MSLSVCPSAFIRRAVAMEATTGSDRVGSHTSTATAITSRAAHPRRGSDTRWHGDTQHLRDVSGRDALLPELTGFGGIGVVNFAWASALAPVRCRSDETGPGALDHGVAFELSEGGHDGQHGLAHRPLGVQTFGEAAESDPPGRQLVHHRENVLGVASKAIKFPDGEHIALAEVVQAGIKLGSARRSAADTVVGEHARRPGFVERIELKLGIRVGGADSRVPDNRHWSVSLSHNPVKLSF